MLLLASATKKDAMQKDAKDATHGNAMGTLRSAPTLFFNHFLVYLKIFPILCMLKIKPSR